MKVFMTDKFCFEESVISAEQWFQNIIFKKVFSFSILRLYPKKDWLIEGCSLNLYSMYI